MSAVIDIAALAQSKGIQLVHCGQDYVLGASKVTSTHTRVAGKVW